VRVEAALMQTRVIDIIPMSQYPKRVAVNVPGMLFTIRSVGEVESKWVGVRAPDSIQGWMILDDELHYFVFSDADNMSVLWQHIQAL